MTARYIIVKFDPEHDYPGESAVLWEMLDRWKVVTS